MIIDLNNRKFKSLSNTENGEVSDETFFYYKQEGKMVWAEYGGGPIKKGFLIGKVIDDHLEFAYQHLNQTLEIMTGECTSYPEMTDTGKIQLNEKWKWTCKDFSSGESILIEV